MTAIVIPFPLEKAELASTESLVSMAQLIAAKQGAPWLAEYMLKQALKLLESRNNAPDTAGVSQ